MSAKPRRAASRNHASSGSSAATTVLWSNVPSRIALSALPKSTTRPKEPRNGRLEKRHFGALLVIESPSKTGRESAVQARAL